MPSRRRLFAKALVDNPVLSEIIETPSTSIPASMTSAIDSAAGDSRSGQGGTQIAGGAGGGYYGGGGGHTSGAYGGGGSGYLHPTYITNGTTTTGSYSTPANSADPDRGSAGQGGTNGSDNATDGKIIISLAP